MRQKTYFTLLDRLIIQNILSSVLCQKRVGICNICVIIGRNKYMLKLW